MPDTVTKTPVVVVHGDDGGLDSGIFGAFIVAGVIGVLVGATATSIYFLAVVDDSSFTSTSSSSQSNQSWSVAQELRLISLETSGYIWPDCLTEAHLLNSGDMSIDKYNTSYCGAYGWLLILSMCATFWTTAWYGGNAVGNWLFDGIDPNIEANSNRANGDAGFDTAVLLAGNYADLQTTDTKIHSKSRMRREHILTPLISDAPRARPPGLFSDDEEEGYLANLGKKRLSPMLREAAAESANTDNNNTKSPARRRNGGRRTRAAVAESFNEMQATSASTAFAHVPLPCKAFGTANEMPILLITSSECDSGITASAVIEPLVENGCFVVHVDGSALSTRSPSSSRGSTNAANACAALVDAVLILRHNTAARK